MGDCSCRQCAFWVESTESGTRTTFKPQFYVGRNWFGQKVTKQRNVPQTERFEKEPQGIGECRRYPNKVSDRIETLFGYWCGEFKRIEDV